VAKKKLPARKIVKEESPKHEPKVDNTFYFYKHKKKWLLQPIPYVWKPNYHYILELIKK